MIELRLITQKAAFAFVAANHRHHNVPVGALWWHAAHNDDGTIIGVAVVEKAAEKGAGR